MIAGSPTTLTQRMIIFAFFFDGTGLDKRKGFSTMPPFRLSHSAVQRFGEGCRGNA